MISKTNRGWFKLSCCTPDMLNGIVQIHFRMGGEQSEMYFCDQKSLSLPTLRMTCEAKNQLRDILINTGFPEDCLLAQVYNYHGPDTKLDMVLRLIYSLLLKFWHFIVITCRYMVSFSR